MEGRAARQGTNFKAQAEAADLFKTAALRVHKLFQGRKSKLVAYIHDELFMYLHKSELFLLPMIKECMEDFPQYTVPILVEMAWSSTDWASKVGLK
jgi:DNA polymerase I-like protein with 3'-5' exonuclease and polymerase domains